MSNEFVRSVLVSATLRFHKFVAGLRVRAWHAIPVILGKAEGEARAADNVDYAGGIAQARPSARPALEGHK